MKGTTYPEVKVEGFVELLELVDIIITKKNIFLHAGPSLSSVKL